MCIEKHKRKLRSLRSSVALTVAMSLIASTVHAGVYCVGSVSNVYSRTNGRLGFKAGFRGDYVTLCNLHETWNGVTAEQCKSWYPILISAQLDVPPRFSSTLI
jgi:hypothetical protein